MTDFVIATSKMDLPVYVARSPRNVVRRHRGRAGLACGEGRLHRCDRGDRLLPGGGLALLLAPDRGFAVSIVNYGTASKDAYAADFLERACPIVGSYGGKGRMLRGAAERLEKILTDVGVDHDVKEYPEAGHEFLNDHEGAGDKAPADGSSPSSTRI